MNCKKLEIRVEDLKMTLILQKRRFLLILIFRRVLKSSDNLPRNGKTVTKSFFSAVKSTSTRCPLKHQQDIYSKKLFDFQLFI